ncbi:MAG TPA: hypothetical protein VLH85_08055, partial [Levilinea sp.]|nr:hypothetical protein [Levilinea sp.]
MTAPARLAPALPAFLKDWSFTSAASGDAVSFDPGAASVEEHAPTFRLDLPAGDRALAVLDAAEHRLQCSEMVLEGIPGELDALLLAERSGAVSFEVAASPAAAELLELLEHPEMTSFGLFSRERKKLEDNGTVFQDVLRRLSEMVSRMAYVETSVQGRLVGRTRVGWSGDFESLFPDAVTAKEFILHQRSLNLALASRRLAVS